MYDTIEALLPPIKALHEQIRDAVVAACEASTTTELAARLEDWMSHGRDVCFLIGGADGLDDAVRDRADLVLSLSRLTMPHALVRVVLAEQLYRAISIIRNHPYHRE